MRSRTWFNGMYPILTMQEIIDLAATRSYQSGRTISASSFQ